MSTIFMSILLLLFSFIRISKSERFQENINLRILDEPIGLYFLKADNLIFNSQNKWEFDVQYIYSSNFITSQQHKITILYNGNPSIALCKHKSYQFLRCTVENESQNQLDLVQLYGKVNDEATINWLNLTSTYPILQNVSLKFKRAYDLYLITNRSSYYWNFTIEVLEKVLPDNGIVKVDVYFGSGTNFALCTNYDKILKCKITASSSQKFLISLKPVKTFGTVDWENINTNYGNISIALNITFTKITFANNLEIIDNKWNFNLKASTSYNLVENSYFITGIKLQKISGNSIITSANCFALSEVTNYRCQIEFDNPGINDLVFLINPNDGIAVKWKTFTEYQITRLINLNFVKAYDLQLLSGKWYFKIEIEDELISGIAVSVDLKVGDTSKTAEEALCTHQNKILFCNRTSLSQRNNDIIVLTGIRNKGSITWNNMKLEEYKIPLITQLKYTKAYGLLFLDKWYFMIDAIVINNYFIPKYSKTKIDIIHNSIETTATCEMIEGSVRATVNISCVSDFENQSKKDIIQINPKKVLGLVEWSPTLTDKQEISLIENAESSLELTFIDAYDMEYSNNKWVFTIKGKSKSKQKTGKKYTIDITGTKENSPTATCILNEGMQNINNIIFRCVCDAENQSENDLIRIVYPQSSLSTLLFTAGISEYYPITLQTSLTLVKGYNLHNSGTWEFLMEVKDGILPKGSKVIVTIFSLSPGLTTGNCTAVNKNLLSCQTAVKINCYMSYTDNRLLKSSVKWNKFLDLDFNFYLSESYNYYSSFNLFFNRTLKKWTFSVDIYAGIKDSKFTITVLYNEEPTIALCYKRNPYVECVVQKEEQNIKDLVKMAPLSQKLSEASVYWKNLEKGDFITLLTDLTFSEVKNLKVNPDNNKTWIFEIYVKDEDIPENSKIVVDIVSIRTNNKMNVIYTNYFNSTATCHYFNKILKCEADYEKDGINYGVNYLINLKTTKTLYSKSNVTKWHNVDKEIMQILFVSTIGYHYCNQIKKVNGKYTFFCEILPACEIPVSSEFTIDILIGDRLSTSFCTADTFRSFNCIIKDEDYTTPYIYISNTKSIESTITWYNLYENQYLFPIKLKYDFAYIGTNEASYYYTFKMLASGDMLKHRIRFPILMKHILNLASESYDEYGACELLYGVLFCHWTSLSLKIYPQFDTYYLILQEKGELVEWINPGKVYIDEMIYNLTYDKLNFIGYNDANKYYEFSLNAEGNYNSTSKIIIDLFFGETKTYAYCIPGSNLKEINCHTPELEFPINIIKIKIAKYLGNTIWANLYNDEKICCDNNYYLIQISKIFDLHYDLNNKWKFTIKPKDNLEFTDAQTLDISIDGKSGFANCAPNAGSLICEVDSENQNNKQLIKLHKNLNYEGKIQIMNLENFGIPFNINLNLLKAYDLQYDSENKNWSFKISTKKNNNIDIPNGSIFSMDIKYDGITGELAFCTIEEYDDLEDNIILLCKPDNEIKSSSLISLNKNKLLYSSITWSNKISDESIINSAELNVLNAGKLQFNSNNNKWSFEINVFATKLPINSKIKIDLIYNEEDTTATCILSEIDKFICQPDGDNQNKDDIFVISHVKKEGTVSYINENNLEFLIEETEVVDIPTEKIETEAVDIPTEKIETEVVDIPTEGVETSKPTEKIEIITNLPTDNIQINRDKYLKFEKVYDLKFNKKWEFKIKLSEHNIQKENIIIDIIVDEFDSTSDCEINDKILSCIVNYPKQNINNEIKLKNNKKNDSFKWINLDDTLDIYMSYQIKFINVYGGFHENKWKFNIYYKLTDKTKKIYDKNVLLDILVNNQESTALCELTYSSFLKCISNHENQNKNDNIKILGDINPNLGTVSFLERLTDDEKIIKPINLNINYDNIYGYMNKNKYQFDIRGNLAKTINHEIEEETFTQIEVLVNSNNKETKKDAICLTNNIKRKQGNYVFLACEIEEAISGNEKVTINMDNNGLSKYVKFNQIGKIQINKNDDES